MDHGNDTALLAQLSNFAELAQPRLEEPVESACLFTRGGMMTKKVAGHFGFLAYLLAGKRFEQRAGGLPSHFVLAVTPTRVHAFQYQVGRGGERPLGPEVAVWERDGLEVASRRGGPLMTDVTIASPREGERITVSVGASEISDAFIRLLQRPVPAGAAA